MKARFRLNAQPEYTPVALFPDNPPDRAYLGWEGGDGVLDVTHRQWALSLQPMVIGVLLDEQMNEGPLRDAERYSLSFVHERRLNNAEAPGVRAWIGSNVARFSSADLLLQRFAIVEEPDFRLLLLRATKARLNQLSAIREAVRFGELRLAELVRKRQHSTDGTLRRQWYAAFSFPRRVSLMTVQHRDYLNIFPMDFQGAAGQRGHHVLGLRNTNLAVAAMRESGKLVVSDAPASARDTLYLLGKHHTTPPQSLDELPMQTLRTRQFDYVVPSTALRYRELRLIRSFSLGSHSLFIGVTVNECHHTDALQLHHVSRFQQLLAEKLGAPYLQA